MAKTLSLTNLVDIECDSIMIKYKDIYDIFLTKEEGGQIVGISPDDLNTLQEIANAIGNDADFFNTINNQLANKANTIDVYNKNYIDNLILNYYSKIETTTLLDTKLNVNVINNYYNKTQIDDFLNLNYTKIESDTLLNLKADKLTTYTKVEANLLLANKLDISTYNAGIILKANIADTYDKTVLYTKLETESFLNLKSNSTDVYSKSAADLLLDNKLDISTYNTGINLKANITDVYNKTVLYTKTETDTLLLNKVNNSTLNNYYTQAQINQSFSNYYNKAYVDIEFDKYYNKTYVDATVSTLNDNINLKLNAANILNYYNKTETDTLFSNLIDSAPDAMNTLKELANALGNDANYAATVENQIALKRNIADSYSKIEVDEIFNNDRSIVKTATLEFLDVNEIGIDTLLIKGGTYITIQDSSSNPLIDLDNSQISIMPVTRFFNNVIIDGSASISNIYNKSEVNNLLDNKQNTLIDRGGDGVVIIDIGTSNKVSRIFGSNIDVYRYLNLSDNTDPKNYNILIDATALKNSIDANTASINTLSTNVNVNSLDITSLDLNLSSGLNARYTKTETDNRYYTQSQVDTLNNSKQDLLNSGNTINLDVGRGLVYLENHIADNQDGSGITLRASSNPTSNGGAMFSVRSSGGACRFWCGQALTSSGINNFGICATGANSEMNDETKYKHLFTSTGAKLTGTIEIADEIKSGDGARFYEYDGGTYKVLNIVHDFGINMAVSSNTNPATNEILLSMDTTTGVAINTSAYVENNLAVGGTFSASNIYTKTEVDGLVSNAGGSSTPVYINAYASVDSASFATGVITVVPYDTIRFSSIHFTLSNNEITINNSGIYNISYNITTTATSGSNIRVSSGAILEVNYNSAGFFVVPGTSVYMYNRRYTDDGKNSGSANCILNLNTNDKLRVVSFVESGSITVKTLANSCGITITKL